MSRFKTPKEAREWLRAVLGPPMRELTGKEKDDILLLLKMISPFKQTNNQRSWTDYYTIGDKEYHVSYLEDDIIVELMLDEYNE